MKLKAMDYIAMILVIIGALNWGLFGIFDFDLVSYIFNDPASMGSKLVYDLIGLAGLYNIYVLSKLK